MTSLNDRQRASQIIGEVFLMTDEENLQHLIDRPIMNAVARFSTDITGPVSHQRFLQGIRDFVMHMYESGLPVGQKMSPGQALSEAIWILERSYWGPPADRYDTAYLDASEMEDGGLEFVLIHMAHSMIAVERKSYMRWVYASRVIPLEWPLRCLTADIMIERWKPYLPEKILGCLPEQLADCLPELFDALRDTDAVIAKVTSADLNTSAPETTG